MSHFIDWQGERFEVREPTGTVLFDFAEKATDADANDFAALRETKLLLRDIVVDFDRFWAHATAVRASTQDLAEAFWKSLAAAADRPTPLRSASSDGPQPTPGSSMDASSLQVIDGELSKGRPDLAYAVYQTTRARREHEAQQAG